jgi:hypothetical protein
VIPTAIVGVRARLRLEIYLPFLAIGSESSSIAAKAYFTYATILPDLLGKAKPDGVRFANPLCAKRTPSRILLV